MSILPILEQKAAQEAAACEEENSGDIRIETEKFGLYSLYLFIIDRTPRIINAIENTTMISPPIIVKMFAISSVINAEVGRFAKAYPATTHAR